MKLRLVLAPSLSALFATPEFFKPTSTNGALRIISRSSSDSCPPLSESSKNPKTPLFLRPPVFSATMTDLQKWQNWARTLASSVGSSFSDSDNGPDAELLHRELNWLIQDALQDPRGLVGNPKTRIPMRVNLDELYVLWKQRIEERRPFQYLVGCEHWRDLVLSVEEGVLIPRPETELIVDLVEEAMEKNEELREGLWADLGTGSGAIAIGIGRILGNCDGSVIATDLSPVAVQVAEFNVKRYNLQDKIMIKQGSWFEPLREVEGNLAGIVSNPPYIPSECIPGLQAEVGRHEPRLALDGGENGMGDLLHLCNGATSMLKPGGFFAFETNGEDQCRLLVDYMEKSCNAAYCNLNIIPDFAGINRFVTGFRAG